MQNRCTHRSFPLHHGRLEGEVVCRYHGLGDNAMGACVNAPMLGKPAPHAKLRHYSTAVRGPLASDRGSLAMRKSSNNLMKASVGMPLRLRKSRKFKLVYARCAAVSASRTGRSAAGGASWPGLLAR